MDNTQHAEDCYWFIQQVTKSKKWYDFMNIQFCPNCKALVEVTDEEA